MKDKVKAFLNSLTWDGAREFWRFLRSKTWTDWVNTRVANRKIE